MLLPEIFPFLAADLPAPTNVQDAVTPLGTKISWQYSGTIVPLGYIVEYWPKSDYNAGNTVQVMGETSVVLTGLPGNTAYYVKVSAYTESGNGKASNRHSFLSTAGSKFKNG